MTNENENEKELHIKIKIGGTATIGPKGQVVIPKEVRDSIGLLPGDSVLFLYNEEKCHIGLIKNDNLDNILKYMNSHGNGIRIDID